MSSLMVSNDLDIMMLEFAVERLFVPKTTIFDDVIMKRTTVMFRMLDYDWTSVNPNRTDYAPYKGSNLEEENFHGGKSIVFAIPSASLERKMKGVDIQIHVRKNVSRYFEMDSCQNVGVAVVNVDGLFNGIINELREREELKEYLSCLHMRQPISRSLKRSYEILDEEQRRTGASIGLYVRLSYFGKSIITEIDKGCGIRRAFYAQEETNELHPYQCKELKRSDLEGGCWGSRTFLTPVRPDRLACNCDRWKSVYEQTDEKSDHSDDEKGDRGADSRTSRADKDEKYSTGRRSTDGKGRRSNGDRAGRGKGKNGEKAGKKYRAVNETADKDKNGKKGVKDDGDVIKDGGETGEENGRTGEAIHPDRMEIVKDERESRKDVYTREGDSRRGDAEENERKPVKERKRRSRDGDGKSDGRSSDDDGRASGRAKGQVGTVRRVGKTGGAYADEKRGKKGADGINAAAGNVEKLEPVKDGRTKKDFKDQKTLGDSRDRSAVTPTTATDGVARSEECTADGRQTLLDAEGSTATSEYIKRWKQSRKRRRGMVTVGLDDREKKICHEDAFSTVPKPTSPIVSASVPLEVCSNLHHRPSCCYHPWPPAGSGSLYVPHACFIDARREGQDQLFAGLNAANIADMEILTN